MTEIGEPIETNDFNLAQEVLVVYGDDDSGYHYVKSDGSEFFSDGIDYDNARNLDADLRKQAIG